MVMQTREEVVMAGQSRSKNGVASAPYVPAIHVFISRDRKQDVDPRHKAAQGRA